MVSLIETLRLAHGSAVAVIGCGGKTSLIRLLADAWDGGDVLISPTTRMYPMDGSVGVFHADTGKLHALPEDALARIVPAYALALLEADGSRGLPCKGWLESEPVIPPYCTHTVGVVTLRALGKPATAEWCLRLPAFLALTGLREGDEITLQALTDMVCAPEGMFRRSRGDAYLLVNQVEDAASAAVARAWLLSVKAAYPGRFAGLLYGSVHHNEWVGV